MVEPQVATAVPSVRRPLPWQGLIAITVWGMSFIATRIALESLAPVMIVAIRLVMGAAILVCVVARRGGRLVPIAGDLPTVVLLGGVLALHMLLQAWGLGYTSAINTGWIIGFIPVIIAIGATLLGLQRIGWVGWAGVLLGTAGIFTITAHAPPDFAHASFGDSLQVLSCFTWATYTLMAIGPIRRNGVLCVTTFGMVVAAGVTLLAALGTDINRLAYPDRLQLRLLAAILFLGVFCSGVGYYMWFASQRTHGPAVNAALLYLEPFVTLIAALLILHEPLMPTAIVGGLIVLAGVYLVSRGSERPREEEAPPARRSERPSLPAEAAKPLAWGDILAAPTMAALRPLWAARRFVRAPRTAFQVALWLHLMLFAMVLLLIMAWRRVQYFRHPFRLSSWWECWLEWHDPHRYGWFGPVEATLLFVGVLGFALLWFLTWIALPYTHRGGPVGDSVWRTFRATAVIVGPITLATAAAGIVQAELLDALDSGWWVVAGMLLDPHAIILACILGLLWLLLTCWLRATWAAADTEAPQLSPRCEGCGYDLTHTPADGRCPECGAAVVASLDIRGSRPGWNWDRERHAPAYFDAAWRALTRPTCFYRRMPLAATLDAALAFRRWTVRLIGLGIALWIFALLLHESLTYPWRRWPNWIEGGCVAVVSVLFGTFVLYLGSRVAGAAVATWWLARRDLPDMQRGALVIAYESAFLWVLCAFWGVLVTSVVLFEDWITLWIGLPRWGWWLGIPAEIWVLFFGTGVLLAMWLVRYAWAMRAVRWGNAEMDPGIVGERSRDQEIKGGAPWCGGRAEQEGT